MGDFSQRYIVIQCWENEESDAEVYLDRKQDALEYIDDNLKRLEDGHWYEMVDRFAQKGCAERWCFNKGGGGKVVSWKARQ
jgi:hypothetical protein